MVKTVPGAVPAGILILSVIFADGCAVPPANLTASFGGSTAGARGAVRVLFINNTPQRAVFTYGTYDQTDQFSQPDFRQFGLNSTDLNLDGDSESSIEQISGQSPLICARVFGVGSPDLLRLIDENLSGATVIENALSNGVEFFDVGDDGDAEAASAGFAPPFEALLDVDFPCAALLIVRFEVSDVGPDPFRIDFELIPSGSTR